VNHIDLPVRGSPTRLSARRDSKVTKGDHVEIAWLAIWHARWKKRL